MLPPVVLDLLALHMLVGDLFLPQVLATEASDLENPQRLHRYYLLQTNLIWSWCQFHRFLMNRNAHKQLKIQYFLFLSSFFSFKAPQLLLHLNYKQDLLKILSRQPALFLLLLPILGQSFRHQTVFQSK